MDMVVEAYYKFLTLVFSPILSLHPAIAELIIAGMITFVITLFYKFLVDQKKMKSIREKIKEMQKEAKEHQKTDPEKANKITAEMFKLTNQQMKTNMKPMIVTLLFVILIFPWLKTVFIGPIVQLPVTLMGRTSFGWLLWYITISIPLSMTFRKLMGVM